MNSGYVRNRHARPVRLFDKSDFLLDREPAAALYARNYLDCLVRHSHKPRRMPRPSSYATCPVETGAAPAPPHDVCLVEVPHSVTKRHEHTEPSRCQGRPCAGRLVCHLDNGSSLASKKKPSELPDRDSGHRNCMRTLICTRIKINCKASPAELERIPPVMILLCGHWQNEQSHQ